MNKKFYSFGIAAMMLLFSGNVMATDYYLSATGNDDNDGKTAATAWATLTKVSSKIANGDHVYVNGIIKVKNVGNLPEWSNAHKKDVVFEGVNPNNDGFDGEGENQLFNLNDAIFTFKNLSFKNGKLTGTNGNNANSHAAAIWGNGLVLTLDNCIFEGNVSEEGNNNYSAGAVYVSGNTNKNLKGETLNCGIFATNTQFINNQAVNGQGGAVTVASNGEFKNCYFKGNVAQNAGGAIMANGAASLKIDGCTFESNVATTTTGGAINTYIDGKSNLSYLIANSTFYKNKCQGNGGAYYWNQRNTCENNTISFVHCTMVENVTASTIGHGGGINIDNRTGVQVNIINSLLQGNLASDNPNSFADAVLESTSVKFVGSYVGALRRHAQYESNYTVEQSKLNDLEGNIVNKDDTKDKLAYADYVEALHVIPLKSSSDATIDGVASADAEYGVTKDQLGNDWTEYPYVGAVQLTDEQVAAGISGIKTDAPKSIKGIYNIAGQYVGNDASQLAKGLYIINGKKVVVK